MINCLNCGNRFRIAPERVDRVLQFGCPKCQGELAADPDALLVAAESARLAASQRKNPGAWGQRTPLGYRRNSPLLAMAVLGLFFFSGVLLISAVGLMVYVKFFKPEWSMSELTWLTGDSERDPFQRTEGPVSDDEFARTIDAVNGLDLAVSSLNYGYGKSGPGNRGAGTVPYYRYEGLQNVRYRVTLTETSGSEQKSTTSEVTLIVHPLHAPTMRGKHLSVLQVGFMSQSEVLGSLSFDQAKLVPTTRTALSDESQFSWKTETLEISPEGRVVFLETTRRAYPVLAHPALLPFVEFPVTFRNEWSTSEPRATGTASMLGAPADALVLPFNLGIGETIGSDTRTYRVISDSDDQLVVHRDIVQQSNYSGQNESLRGGGLVVFNRRVGFVSEMHFSGFHDRPLREGLARVAIDFRMEQIVGDGLR